MVTRTFFPGPVRPETAGHVIETVLKPKVVGRDLEELRRIRANIDHVLTGHPRAKQL
jgi:hypothetical protein